MERSLALIVTLALGFALSAAAQTSPAPSASQVSNQSGKIHGHLDLPVGTTGMVFLSGPEDHTMLISTSGNYSGTAVPGRYSLVVQEVNRSAGYPKIDKFTAYVDIQPGKDTEIDFDRFGNPHAPAEETLKRDATSQLRAAVTQHSFSAATQSLADVHTLFASGAPVPSAKIAVISFQTAVAQTDEGKRSFAGLQKKYAPKAAQLKAQNGEIDSLTKQLQAQGNALSEIERAVRAKLIDDKKKQAKQLLDEAQKEMNTEMQEMYNGMASKVYSVMTSYAQQRGYTLVLDVSHKQNPVLYATESSNITKAVIDAYKAK